MRVGVLSGVKDVRDYLRKGIIHEGRRKENGTCFRSAVTV